MKIKKIQKNNSEIIQLTCNALDSGAVILFPFDTVYGLICDANNEKAVEKIFSIKKRSELKVLGLAASDMQMIEDVAVLTENQSDYILGKISGPYTFLVKAKKATEISTKCIKNGIIGVRVPDCPLLLETIRSFGKPVAQTSANISGQSNCYSVDEFLMQYKSNNEIDLLIDAGELPQKNPSTIIDLTGTTPKAIERSS
jgi:tRNA threonylcarbamoyl adenosine modification protein (Sua5/YciO/YrdC/YwlC family)